jgi:ribosomal protection tetracycline resistance protein
MPTQTINIGILAHVDAGKTSLTERLLYDSGVIDRLGSVDAGTTQTDTGAIERRRGITIRSAVTAFTVADRRVNVIDTPGHSDFVAEVERALGVLDGAVLVLSAVEGVQPHTRLLMRLLRRLRLPALIFVNKIDRMGARSEALLADIRATLTPNAISLGGVVDLGAPTAAFVPYTGLPTPTSGNRPAGAFVGAADRDGRAGWGRLAADLAERDEELLADLVADVVPRPARLVEALREQTAAASAYPVIFGCALSGAGVTELREAIGTLLPASPPAEPTLRARVFAIERGPGAEKIAYLRSYGGQLRPRQRVTVYRLAPGGEPASYSGQVSAVQVIGAQNTLTAGEIAQIRGLPEIRIGDQIGSPACLDAGAYVARPTLETVVRPGRPRDTGALHAALVSLADQDPLIATRVTPEGQSSLLLYGEVQAEVIAATLAEVYGVPAEFEPTQVVHLERLVGSGAAVEQIGHGFAAGVGLRVEPAPPGTGVRYRLEVELGALPLSFHKAVEETVRLCLEQGVYGWPVPDALVTMTHCAFWAPISTAGDFRGLTPLVLARALAQAGTRVHEPCLAFDLQIPLHRLAPVSARLAKLAARIDGTVADTAWQLTGEIPVRTAARFHAEIAGLTGGEGTWSTRPGGDCPVTGPPPTRPRTDGNPYDRVEYLRARAQR